MAESSRTRAGLSLWACVATQLTFDLANNALRGDLGPPGYAPLVVGLTLAVAVALSALAAALRAPPWLILGAWVGLESMARWEAVLPAAPLASCLAALTGFAVARARFTPATAAPATAGLVVGCALCAGWILARPAQALVEARLGVGSGPDWLGAATGFALVLVVLSRRGGARLWRVPVVPAASALLLASALAATAAYHRPPDRSGFYAASAAEPAGPNILLLILDTVRADHLSVYGYARNTTPKLARLVADPGRTTLFPNAYSPSNWTVPAHLSLFTGTLPSEHQAHCGNQAHLRSPVIDPPPTLAEKLGIAGYRTAAVIANPNAMSVDGMGRGFDLWMLAPAPHPLSFLGERLREAWLPLHHRSVVHPLAQADAVNVVVLDLLAACPDGGCLIVANYVDAHSPFWPSAPFAGRFDPEPLGAPSQLRADDPRERARHAMTAYDEEILALDDAIGDLVDALERRGSLDSLWLFVTSDHGEAFAEHASVHHASSLYEEQTRVPLIVRRPEGEFLPVRTDPVGLLDVTATISAIATGETLGIGRDLRDPNAPEQPVQAEFFGCPHPKFSWGPYTDQPARAAWLGSDKLLEVGGRLELYELDVDVAEQTDRAAQKPRIVERLTEVLPPLEQRNDRLRDPGALLDASNAEALRALGYIE